MTDAWRMLFRAEMRARWPVMLMLAFFVAQGSGVTFAAASAAVRTATAFDRLLEVNDGADLLLRGPQITGAAEHFGMVPARDLDAPTLAGVPGVVDAGTAGGVILGFPEVEGLRPVDLFTSGGQLSVVSLVALDDHFGRTLERPVVVGGRLANPDRSDEIVVSEGLARFAGWEVGERVQLRWMSTGVAALTNLDPADPANETAVNDAFGRSDAIVVGIADAIQRDRAQHEERVLTTPAFGRQPGLLVQYTYHVLRTAPGVDPNDVIRFAVARGFAPDQSSADVRGTYRDSVRPDVVSLALFAVISYCITILVMGQALGREARMGGLDNDVRKAIGMTVRQLASIAMVRVVLIVLTGVTVGIGAAVAASGRLARSVSESVEPSRGVWVDHRLLFGVGGLLLVGYTVLAVWPAISAARTRPRPGHVRPSRLVTSLAASGAPAPVIVGVRHALEASPGRPTVPVRTALAMGALGAALAVASMVFTTSLDRLLNTPESYGATWQLQIETNYDEQRDDGDDGSCTAADGRCGDYATVLNSRMTYLADLIAGDDDIIGATPYSTETIEIEGRRIGVYAMSDGPVQPLITDGDQPRDGEIALGHATMKALDVSVGDIVTANSGKDLRIVGVALVPEGLPGEPLGQGGIITARTASEIEDRAMPRGFLIRASPNVSLDAVLARYATNVTGDEFDVARAPEPAQIGDYRRIRDTPLYLALGITALGTGMLLVGVLSAVLHRQREYALLQALGATRRQIATAIQAQVLVSVGIVLVAGIPIGLTAGTLAWKVFEQDLGTRSGAHSPLARVLVAAFVIGAAALLLAHFTARHRTLTAPAQHLRSE